MTSTVTVRTLAVRDLPLMRRMLDLFGKALYALGGRAFRSVLRADGNQDLGVLIALFHPGRRLGGQREES